MSNLLTLNYWFSLNPEPWLQTSFRLLLSVFGGMIILGLLAGLFVRKNKEDNLKRKFWDKVQNLFLLIGFLGVVLVFSRQQRIGFLGMPFLLLILGLWALYWTSRIVRYVVKIIPERREEQKKKEEKKKYL
ncbi:MAG TPA: hypothetical protein P5267_01035 [Patescibacteria group bacterium]|nr:hypothetical protein [Patescibacteria group bacterium]